MVDMKSDSVKIVFSSREAFIEVEEAEDYSGPYSGKVFNVFYSGCSSPSVSSDVGNVQELQTNVPIDRTEILEFVDEKAASLRYEPSGSVTQEHSTVGSGWTRNGKKISFSEEKVGLLKVSYQTACDRWGFNFGNSSAPTALITFRCGSEVTSEQVEAPNTGGVSIKVVDACTGDPVPNASVTISNKTEVTDENGDVSISGLTEEEHSVMITANGYIDSDKDPLDNDSINVSFDEDEDEEG